jgi:hypothetical protein
LKDDKKKLAVVGVLAFIVIGVGAFQFMGSGSTPTKKAPPAAKKQDLAANTADQNKIKNPEFANPLPERDPFKSTEDAATPPQQPKAPTPPSRPAPPRMSGSLDGPGGTLPTAGGIGTIAPLQITPPAPVFNYRLSGLILGRHPAAVFTDTADKSGSQRLVPIGGSLDGDTQLVAVSKGRAVVSFKGKHLRLTLGGTPDAN